ncbi:uncharacterized protein [Aristolochia californica]|uniref:uncharacterized protein n=1 Tax=Aristolochia californica TaxID=171875 RepID=UPI0035DA96F1
MKGFILVPCSGLLGTSASTSDAVQAIIHSLKIHSNIFLNRLEFEENPFRSLVSARNQRLPWRHWSVFHEIFELVFGRVSSWIHMIFSTNDFANKCVTKNLSLFLRWIIVFP